MKSSFKSLVTSCYQKVGSYAKYINICLYSVATMVMTQRCFADGQDILKDPASNLFATFKGTGVALLIVAEIVGAYSFYRKTGDMKAWIGLPVLLVITAWASTQF